MLPAAAPQEEKLMVNCGLGAKMTLTVQSELGLTLMVLPLMDTVAVPEVTCASET